MTFSNETHIELICLQLRQHVVLAANRNLERITSQTTFTQQQYKRSFHENAYCALIKRVSLVHNP